MAALTARALSEDRREERCSSHRPCRACHLRACAACRDFYAKSADWLCNACREKGEGAELTRRPSRRRESRSVQPPDVVKRSVRRSWTISNPSTRWSSSPAPVSAGESRGLRAYSSLPREARHRPEPDSGVGTQDEAEQVDIVKIMLDKARQREEALLALRAASQPAKAPPDPLPQPQLSSNAAGPGPGPCGACGRRAGGRRRRRAGAGAGAGAGTAGLPQDFVTGPQRVRGGRRGSGGGATLDSSALTCCSPGEGHHGDPSRCLHDGDDFRLVFISSDSSSRDEDDDARSDDDSMSTSSGSPGGPGVALDDCDWDYFEPAVATRLRSPVLGSPSLTRRFPRVDVDVSLAEREVFGSPSLTRRLLLGAASLKRESPTASLLGELDASELPESPGLTRKKLYSASSRADLGLLGAGLDDYDDLRYSHSLPDSPLSTPIQRRQRARIFVDGSPSSSDCSSSGYAVSRRRYFPDWTTDDHPTGSLSVGIQGCSGGDEMAASRIKQVTQPLQLQPPQQQQEQQPQPQQQEQQLHPQQQPGPGPSCRSLTCPGGGGSLAEAQAQGQGQNVPVPGLGQSAAGAGAVTRSSSRSRETTCASCAARPAAGAGSVAVPILLPIPVPVPLPVLVQLGGAGGGGGGFSITLRPPQAMRGGGARKRKGGSRGRGGRAAATSSSARGAARAAGRLRARARAASHSLGDAQQAHARKGKSTRTSDEVRHTSVAEENDNGVVLMTVRPLSDVSVHTLGGTTERRVVEAVDERTSSESSEEDIGMGMDSDSEDEAISRTYCLKDGKTVQEVVDDSNSGSDVSSKIGASREDLRKSDSKVDTDCSSTSGEKSSPASVDDDSDCDGHFSRVFVVNSVERSEVPVLSAAADSVARAGVVELTSPPPAAEASAATGDTSLSTVVGVDSASREESLLATPSAGKSYADVARGSTVAGSSNEKVHCDTIKSDADGIEDVVLSIDLPSDSDGSEKNRNVSMSDESCEVRSDGDSGRVVSVTCVSDSVQGVTAHSEHGASSVIAQNGSEGAQDGEDVVSDTVQNDGSPQKEVSPVSDATKSDPPGISAGPDHPDAGQVEAMSARPGSPPSAPAEGADESDTLNATTSRPPGPFGEAAEKKTTIQSVAPQDDKVSPVNLKDIFDNERRKREGVNLDLAADTVQHDQSSAESEMESKPEAEMASSSCSSMECSDQADLDPEFSGTESMDLSPRPRCGYDSRASLPTEPASSPDPELAELHEREQTELEDPEPGTRWWGKSSDPVMPLGGATSSPRASLGFERNSVESREAGRPLEGHASPAPPGSLSPSATAKYTSLVMITQESGGAEPPGCREAVSVSVVSGTPVARPQPVTLLHTNLEDDLGTVRRGATPPVAPPRRTIVSRRSGTPNSSEPEDSSEDTSMGRIAEETPSREKDVPDEPVKVVTGGDTLSAVICLEEGLADDDSWVEEIEQDRSAEVEEEFATTTATDTSSGDEANVSDSSYLDREEELRGYHRAAIDFTLHTILEESCEESEVEQPAAKKAPSASDLEKYFFFGLGGGAAKDIRDADTLSETNSSIYSEGLESLGTEDGVEEDGAGDGDDQVDPAELASSRLEKYFLSGFMGFPSNRRDSDGSVGSDSEGRPSPEQRRKRLVRARGTGRAHSNSNSLDNLAAADAGPDAPGANEEQPDSEDSSSSTETDVHEEPPLAVDGQFDTVKRKKRKRSVGSCSGSGSPAVLHELDGIAKRTSSNELLSVTIAGGSSDEHERDGSKTPQPELALPDLSATRPKQQSRDSGFVGSCDDLLRSDKGGSDSSTSSADNGADLMTREASPRPDEDTTTLSTSQTDTTVIVEEPEPDPEPARPPPALQPAPQPSMRTCTPPAAGLTRKDSFNNWSSDEETNLMMSKMRAFFKTMVGPHTGQGQPSTATAGQTASAGPRKKPPQLLYFESELTRLMKTVPGIRDEQVRELVEYLSSEDTWSDSYDSSDYTSSDLEGRPRAAAGQRPKSALQQEISASCQQIISNFDTSGSAGASTPTGTPVAPGELQVYQRLVASLSRMGDASRDDPAVDAGREKPAGSGTSTPHSSPPIFAKVIQHIGGRLVALMHEVSSGEGSPRARYTHRRLQQKISSTSTTTEEDEDSVTDTEESDSNRRTSASMDALGGGPGVLARSVSHDLLGLGGSHGPAGGSCSGPHCKDSLRSSSSGVSDLAAEDSERFSWRGSFESALMATDSRTRLDGSVSASSSALAMAAKRRSAGDLLFSHKSLSRDQLDRVRSCGSIGGTVGAAVGGAGGGSSGSVEGRDLLWGRSGRRASVPDANISGGSADGDEDDDGEDDLDDLDECTRSTTLPRSLQTSGGACTNSLPRLSTSGTVSMSMLKAQSLAQVQSARYRPPGYSRAPPSRALSAPGLGQVQGQPSQPALPRRDRRRAHLQQHSLGEFAEAVARGSEMRLRGEDGSSETSGSPGVPCCSGSPSPVSGRAKRPGRGSTTSRGSGLSSISSTRDWLQDEDLEKIAGVQRPCQFASQQASTLGPRSDSMASVYSGAGEGRYGTVAVRGEVEFGLQYNYKQSALEIHVVQCRDLAPVDVKRNRSDPYVKVYLLPDKSKGGKRKTRVRKHTLNPVFDETLKFHISLKGLESRTLWLTVWHSDMFGRNDFLGEVMMGLENKVFDDPSPRFYPLQERTEPFDDLLSYRGDVIVALKFIPPDVSGNTFGKKGKRSSKGALHVLVKEAKNLSAVKANGSSDPFCKSYLLPDKGRSSKQKTAVIRRTCNPAWNHTFIYSDISLQELSERALELTVWDHDRIASNEFLGGVRFSLGTGKHYGKPVDWMDSSGKELTLWQRMLERPNLWVESSVTLRPSLERTATSGNSNTM